MQELTSVIGIHFTCQGGEQHIILIFNNITYFYFQNKICAYVRLFFDTTNYQL